jgi:hypothetical protein
VNQPGQISDAIVRAARAVNAPSELQSQLDTIVQVARDSMPEIDHAGVSVAHKDGTVETKAATGDLVHQLDQLQYTLGEGPCLHARRDQRPVDPPRGLGSATHGWGGPKLRP